MSPLGKKNNNNNKLWNRVDGQRSEERLQTHQKCKQNAFVFDWLGKTR